MKLPKEVRIYEVQNKAITLASYVRCNFNPQDAINQLQGTIDYFMEIQQEIKNSELLPVDAFLIDG